MDSQILEQICWDVHSWEDCLKKFLLVNYMSHWRMMDLRLFGNGFLTLSRLMGSYNYFSKITVDDFLWSSNQLHLISSTFLIPVEGVKVYFIFHILLLHFGFWLNNDGCNTSCFVVHLRLCLRNFKTFQGTECRYVLLRKLLEVKVSVLYFYHDCIFPSFCNYFPNYGKSSHIWWSLLTLVFPQLSPVSLCCLMDNH